MITQSLRADEEKIAAVEIKLQFPVLIVDFYHDCTNRILKICIHCTFCFIRPTYNCMKINDIIH